MAGNPLLAGSPGEDEFVARLLAGYGSYPAYFARLPRYNRTGPRVYGSGWPVLPELDVAAARRHLDDGAQLVDARPIARFAREHIPGAISNELRGQFGTWLGWVADPDRPLLIVVDPEQDRAELVRQCLNVGFENLLGSVAGGVESWRSAGLATQSLPLIEAGGLDDHQVLDIRQNTEWQSGHLPGARHVELGTLASGAQVPVEGPTAVMCAHGQRSMTAASLLARDRGTAADLSVVAGGAEDWAQATGRNLEQA
jgi:rhodanese-related sulfurtransferase